MLNRLEIPSLNVDFQEKADLGNELEVLLNVPVELSKDRYLQILNFLDLTSLEGSDTIDKIETLAKKVIRLDQMIPSNVAAVCVYPTFANILQQTLSKSEVNIACVAGAFPSGQSSIDVKLKEIEWALSQGAEEIDMVISRGKLLEGNYEAVFDEIYKIKQICKDVHLKVILETGELQSSKNIRIASDLAIYAGADFIKTSTGKISTGATYESAYIMLQAIKDYHLKTGKKIGLKPAGGISDIETALNYIKLTQGILGESWLNKDLFRIGASRLANNVLNELSVLTKIEQLKNYF